MCDRWKYCTEKKDFSFNHQPSTKCWFGVLAGAARTYLASDGITQTEYTRLFNYGRRRCPEFLGVTQQSLSSVVTLQQPQNLLSLISQRGMIRLLRRKAMRLGYDPRRLIIHYTLPESKHGETAFAIATVIPIKNEAPETGRVHKRWMMDTSAITRHDEDGERHEILGKADLLGPLRSLQNGDRMFWSNAPAEFSDRKLVTSSVDDVFGDFAEMALFRGKVQRGKPRVLTGVPFEFVFGDPATAAIYCILEGERQAAQVFGAEDIRTAMAQKSMDISQSGLIRHLGEIPTTPSTLLTLGPHMLSLKILCTIVKIYEHLIDATIAMTFTSGKLHDAKWMPNTALTVSTADRVSLQQEIYWPSDPRVEEAPLAQSTIIQAFEPLGFDLASSFACIANLESGSIDVPSTGLQSVMAMSSGDSLYIATPLLSDPACKSNSKITRIRGNIGRAGIALLIPPDEPRTREVDPKDWNLINHDEYDGVVTDSFKSTSLHMSFTEFVLPIDTGLHGFRNTEIYFFETVISMHDRGRWMGDLKILPVFKDPLFRILTKENSTCKHTQKTALPPEVELISIDSWYEFFDRPESPIVFRAHGNWMARLAAASMSVAKGHLTLVFGEDICWRCEEIERRHLGHKQKPIYIL